MLERDLENALAKYPELIEDGMSFLGRQVHVDGKFVDLLFKDKHGVLVIVEVKRGIIKREHIAQLLDYEGYFLRNGRSDVRVMLVGNKVPNNFQNSLDHHGIEWREIPFDDLKHFLEDKKDIELLNNFSLSEANQNTRSPKHNNDDSSASRSRGNIRIETLKKIVSDIDSFSSSAEMFSIPASIKKPAIQQNLTFWNAICESLWFLHMKNKGTYPKNKTLRVDTPKHNLRIEIVVGLANTIDDYNSPEELFAVPQSRKEPRITQNLSFWKAICDSLWYVYHRNTEER